MKAAITIPVSATGVAEKSQYIMWIFLGFLDIGSYRKTDTVRANPAASVKDSMKKAVFGNKQNKQVIDPILEQ